MNSGRKARNIKTNKLPLEITGEKVDRPKRNLKETNQKLITSIRQAILSSNTEELGALLDSATEEPIQVDFGGVSGSFKLERIDLRKIHIIGMTLNEKHELTEIKFGALTNCRFTNTTLTGCTFHGTTKEMVLVNCKGEGNSFTGEHFNLEMTNICRAFFRQPVSPHRAAGDKQFGSVKPSFGESAKCPFAIWNGDFVDVNLQNVSLGGCHLIQTKLSGVFSGVDLSSSVISGLQMTSGESGSILIDRSTLINGQSEVPAFCSVDQRRLIIRNRRAWHRHQLPVARRLIEVYLEIFLWLVDYGYQSVRLVVFVVGTFFTFSEIYSMPLMQVSVNAEKALSESIIRPDSVESLVAPRTQCYLSSLSLMTTFGLIDMKISTNPDFIVRNHLIVGLHLLLASFLFPAIVAKMLSFLEDDVASF
ncbi:MAG: pentapeptide repeat-containing protein [Planctomyces sp.]|jgi:uncharacterized protein YjbI with pentapeptide repeats|nr:pentapeptide repeat-containing protein [Planctomyces sp.]